MAEQRINVNAASAQELTQLPGIGPVLAERITTYRETVRLFEEPAQITMVSGIGERTYRAIADRLAVAASEESSRPAMEAPQEEMEGMEKTSVGPATEEETEEEIPSEAETLSEEEISPEEEAESEVKAMPVGEPMLEEKLIFAEEEEPPEPGDVAEEAIREAPLEAPEMMAEEEAAPEVTALPPGQPMLEEELTFAEEEVPPEPSDVAEEAIEEAPPEAPEMSAEEEAAPEVEEEPAEEPADVEAVPLERGLPPTRAEERPEPAPSPSWWRRLSWLWTALLGGLLGMAFALVVLSGINGSLDVGHSRAVVDVRGRMDSLATDINSLQGNVDGLRKRLDALEELTVRMDRVEATVGDLQQETVDLGQRADALEEDVAAVNAELEAVSEQVETLQEQAEHTRSFFQALQTLLSDFFGGVEGESRVTPTPEGK